MGLNIAELFVKIGAQLKGFDEAMGKVEKRLHATGEKLQRAGTALSIGVTAPLAALAAGALKASISFESAFASVRKNVDGTEEQLQSLSQGIQDLSTRIPASTKEIAAVASAAGQLGIETENILGFTEAMLKLGETTNMTSDEAATALARLANITQLSQDQFDRLGSTLLALGKSSASTEKEITEMGLRIAGAGAQVGLTESEILAFAAALSSVGIEAEAGGTAISRVFVEIAKSVELGGARLEEFASVAGMSAEDFADTFQRSAAEAVTAFIEGLGRLAGEGKSTLQVLQVLEFENVRIRDALLRSSHAGDLLRKSLALARNEWEANTELTETANKRFETTGAQLEILRNKVVLVAKGLGDALMPAFHGVLGIVNGLVSVLGIAVRAFAGMPGGVKAVVVAMAALVASLGPAILALGTWTKAAAGAAAAMRFLSAHPLVATATALATVTLALTSFVAGTIQASSETRKFGSTAITTADRIRELGKAIEGLGQTEEQLRAEITATEAKLKAFTDGLEDPGPNFEEMSMRVKTLTADLAKLRERLANVQGTARGTTAEKLLLEMEQAAAKAQARFDLLGDEQIFVADSLRIYEGALDDVLGLLPKESDEVAFLTGKIEQLRAAQERLNNAPAKAPDFKLNLSGVKEEIAQSQALAGVLGDVFKKPLDGLKGKVEAAEGAIKHYAEEALKAGMTTESLRADETFKSLIANWQALRGEVQAAQFTHEDFAESFTETFTELASQLQVTGAEVATVIFDVFTSLSQGIGNAVAQAIFYGKDLGEQLVDVVKQIGAAFISSLIAMGIQELLFLILGLGVASKRTAAELASAAAITYAAAYAAATVGSIATGGLSLVAAAGIAAAQTAAMLAGATAAGATGSGVGAGVVALAEGGITKGPTHALIGEAGTEVVSPLAPLLEMIREAVQGVLLGPTLAMTNASAGFLPAGVTQAFNPEPLTVNVDATLVADRRAIARMVLEEMPAILQRKLGNAFG